MSVTDGPTPQRPLVQSPIWSGTVRTASAAKCHGAVRRSCFARRWIGPDPEERRVGAPQVAHDLVPHEGHHHADRGGGGEPPELRPPLAGPDQRQQVATRDHHVRGLAHPQQRAQQRGFDDRADLVVVGGRVERTQRRRHDQQRHRVGERVGRQRRRRLEHGHRDERDRAQRPSPRGERRIANATMATYTASITMRPAISMHARARAELTDDEDRAPPAAGTAPASRRSRR